jgi:hypothetical protein
MTTSNVPTSKCVVEKMKKNAETGRYLFEGN